MFIFAFRFEFFFQTVFSQCFLALLSYGFGWAATIRCSVDWLSSSSLAQLCAWEKTRKQAICWINKTNLREHDYEDNRNTVVSDYDENAIQSQLVYVDRRVKGDDRFYMMSNNQINFDDNKKPLTY